MARMKKESYNEPADRSLTPSPTTTSRFQYPAMPTPSPLDRVLDRKIVAVIRAESPDLLVDVAEALLAGGVEVMEVTFTVPRAARVIEKVADKLGSRILLGAGTVLDTETARAAFLAGAEFIVSPTV